MLSWSRFQDVLQIITAANEKYQDGTYRSEQWTASAKDLFDKAGELLLEVFCFCFCFLFIEYLQYWVSFRYTA